VSPYSDVVSPRDRTKRTNFQNKKVAGGGGRGDEQRQRKSVLQGLRRRLKKNKSLREPIREKEQRTAEEIRRVFWAKLLIRTRRIFGRGSSFVGAKLSGDGGGSFFSLARAIAKMD
jgi:hypothetical protein